MYVFKYVYLCLFNYGFYFLLFNCYIIWIIDILLGFEFYSKNINYCYDFLVGKIFNFFLNFMKNFMVV